MFVSSTPVLQWLCSIGHQPGGMTCSGVFAPAPAAPLAVFAPAPDAHVSAYAFAAAVAEVASDAVMAKEHRSAPSFPKKSNCAADIILRTQSRGRRLSTPSL
jgi:hypothetical protein